MSFFESLIGRNSGRNKALSLYKRGMAKAKHHDRQGAIDDYSAAINLADTSPDVQAMALYNRALVHAASKDSAMATDDLKAVLAMADVPANVKSAARDKLRRLDRFADNG